MQEPDPHSCAQVLNVPAGASFSTYAETLILQDSCLPSASLVPLVDSSSHKADKLTRLTRARHRHRRIDH
eukprot:7680638-Pyramimonas_sp.AAC.2